MASVNRGTMAFQHCHSELSPWRCRRLQRDREQKVRWYPRFKRSTVSTQQRTFELWCRNRKLMSVHRRAKAISISVVGELARGGKSSRLLAPTEGKRGAKIDVHGGFAATVVAPRS